jgi:hypothetical protein
MKTKDFLKKHSACKDGAKWALSIGEEMDAVWDAMIEQGKHDWLLWTATRPGVFPDTVLRKLACRFVRETPLSDGRKVWDLLTDERSRKAVEVAERYADGKATYEELEAARAAAARTAAVCAAFAADDAAYDAAHAVACAAAYDAAHAVACAAAYDAAFAARAACAAAGAAAYDAAFAARAAYDAAFAAADAADAGRAAARAAAYAAREAAKAAQAQMIAEMGNPFKERVGR